MLRSEIKRLQRRIKTLSSAPHDRATKNSSDAQRLWNAAKSESSLLSVSGYMRYTVSKITGGSVFSLWKQASGYFRKFRLISTIMRVLSSILTILGTGAFFIFVSGLLVFLVPFLIIFSAALYIFSTVSRARAFKKLKVYLEGKTVYVMFPARGRPFEPNSVFNQTIHMLSESEQCFTVIVSPYIFSAEGSLRGYYSVLDFNSPNVCIIRKHSFFLLRKRMLESAEKNTVYIH